MPDTTETETAQVYAHELVAEPREDAPASERARYHLARALGLSPGSDIIPESDAGRRQFADRVTLYLAECRVALLVVALERGLTGDEAVRFAGERCHEEVGEWLWQYAVERGVEADRIRRYLLPYELSKQVAWPCAYGHAVSSPGCTACRRIEEANRG